jgi:hypothetical protein
MGSVMRSSKSMWLNGSGRSKDSGAYAGAFHERNSASRYRLRSYRELTVGVGGSSSAWM